MGKVHEFELFFERFLLVFLRNLHLLNVSDLTRLTWAYQNVWRFNFESLFGKESRKCRELARATVNSSLDGKTRRNNNFLHYITILLHTQEM